MVTVDDIYRTLEEMRGIYPFKDEKTFFRMERNVCKMQDTMLNIQTIDEETGIEIRLAKDAVKSLKNIIEGR